MLDTHLFFSHLFLLKQSNPSLAGQLSSFAEERTEKRWIFHQTFGEQNCYRIENDQKIFIHAISGALREAKEIFKQLDLAVDALYVYGIGLGYFYLVALPWLKEDENRSLIFLEDDLSLFKLFLHTAFATEFLLDSQVEVYSITEAIPPKIRQIVEEQRSSSFSCTALPYYEKYKNNTYRELKHQIAFESSQQESNDRELSSHGMHFFNQFYSNLLEIPHSYQGYNLRQQFKNVPAIICGAGPSLIHQLPFLSSLRNRALLFASSSALNILSYHSIWPHFGVAIDPTSESFHRQIMNRGFETPIFYRTRLNHEALHAIHGPCIWMPESSFYALPIWMEKQLKLPSSCFLEGLSVVHQALQIAHFLGCQPIILVGMDLSMNSNSNHPYATGVERHPLFPFQDHKLHLGSPIQLNNQTGKQVTSYWPWLAEAQWLDEYQRLYPELLIYNATENGIILPSILNRSLLEIQQEHLANIYDFDRMAFEKLQQGGTTSVSRSEILCCLKSFQDSLEKCRKSYQEILAHIKEADNFSINNQILAIETRIKQETAYIYLLRQMNDFSLSRSQKEQKKILRLQDEQEKIFRQLHLWMSHYQFLVQNIDLHLAFIFRTEKQAHIEFPLKQAKASSKINSEAHSLLFYASGSLYRQTVTFPDASSTSLFYYEDGTIKSAIQYKDDQLHGSTYLYYPTGLLKRELHFWLGKRHGLEKSWYENGQLFTEIEYDENEFEWARCWLPNGKLHRQIDNKPNFPHK